MKYIWKYTAVPYYTYVTINVKNHAGTWVNTKGNKIYVINPKIGTFANSLWNCIEPSLPRYELWTIKEIIIAKHSIKDFKCHAIWSKHPYQTVDRFMWLNSIIA